MATHAAAAGARPVSPGPNITGHSSSGSMTLQLALDAPVLHPAAFGGCILACLLAVSACGSSSAQSAATPVTAATARSACASGSAFALSLVSHRGGQPA